MHDAVAVGRDDVAALEGQRIAVVRLVRDVAVEGEAARRSPSARVGALDRHLALASLRAALGRCLVVRHPVVHVAVAVLLDGGEKKI